MKKNKDYVSRKKPSFVDNLKVRKTNRDHVMDSYEDSARGSLADPLLLEQVDDDEQARTLQIPDIGGGQRVDYDTDDIDKRDICMYMDRYR